MLIAAGVPQPLGGTDAQRLRFGEEDKPEGAWAGRRLLLLDERPAFELSFWCGTCPFLFKRLHGSNATTSLESLEERLAVGIDEPNDEVINTFGTLLPEGQYIPLLIQIVPRLVFPGRPGDYFSEEQTSTWGVDHFWGLPEYPHTPYYRTFETAVSPTAHLFEFVVPMVPPSWNDAERVARHREALEHSSRPTAVAVSTLDVCQPAVGGGERADHAHWAVTHFLLDGHHKLEAAATKSLPLRLLSLLAIDPSLAKPEQVLEVAKLRGQNRTAWR